jgi:hypothetical protein
MLPPKSLISGIGFTRRLCRQEAASEFHPGESEWPRSAHNMSTCGFQQLRQCAGHVGLLRTLDEAHRAKTAAVCSSQLMFCGVLMKQLALELSRRAAIAFLSEALR